MQLVFNLFLNRPLVQASQAFTLLENFTSCFLQFDLNLENVVLKHVVLPLGEGLTVEVHPSVGQADLLSCSAQRNGWLRLY